MNKKKLRSGIEVDANEYYALLEWKDSNMKEFIVWCDCNYLSYSINDLTYPIYQQLIHYTKI